MSRLPLAMLSLVLCCSPAGAQPLRLPPQPDARFAPTLGARLPLDAVLRDEAGAPVRLGALFGRAPVVLVPGYYTCRNLCSTLFEGAVQALALSGMAAGSYRLVGFSIDPRDSAAVAEGRRQAYAALLPGGADNVRMLTGDVQTLARLESALGYHAPRDPATGEFAHAAGMVVADAEGRVAAFFPGVSFEPAALRTAVQAAHESPGRGDAAEAGQSLGQRLLMLCAHYNPTAGRNDGAAMAAVRAGALLAAAGLAAILWRMRKGRP